MKKEYILSGVAGLVLVISCSGTQEGVKPQHKDITEMVFASGVLEVEDRYNLTAQTDGYLERMNFEEGAIVQKDQVMAVIKNEQNHINVQSASQLYDITRENSLPSAPALQAINANIVAATEKVKLDKHQLKRYARLYESNSVSKIEYDNARLALTTSEAGLKALEEQYQGQQVIARQQELMQGNAIRINRVLHHQNQVTAIVGGKVYVRKKQLGDYVRKGDVIAVIGSPNMLYARLNVDERSIARLKMGQAVEIKLNTNKDKIYKATVKQILPAFDEVSRSFIIKAYFNDPPDHTIAGTQLEANIIIGIKKKALIIPLNYLNYGNKVMLKENKKMVDVNPGIISSEWVEILSGLEAQQTIITKVP